MLNSLAFAETTKNHRFFVAMSERNDQRNVLADRFSSGVSKDSLRTSVPTCDETVEIFADDGVVGGFDDGGKPGAGGKSAAIRLAQSNNRTGEGQETEHAKQFGAIPNSERMSRRQEPIVHTQRPQEGADN